MAFQIVDDVLDLTASEDVLGKPVASDLREGKATMAVLHALEHCAPTERATIEAVLCNGGFNGITPADIVAIFAVTAPSTRPMPAPTVLLKPLANPSAPSPSPRSSACCCGCRSSSWNGKAKPAHLSNFLISSRMKGLAYAPPFAKSCANSTIERRADS